MHVSVWVLCVYSVCVCVHVCTCLRASASMLDLRACVCAGLRACVCAHMRACVWMNAGACVCVCVTCGGHRAHSA